MKIGNTGLEIKFDKLDIVQQYLDICKPCEDLRVVHNSVFDKENYYKQFIDIRKEINEVVNEWNDMFEEPLSIFPEHDWALLFKQKDAENYYEFHRVLNLLHYELLKNYDTIIGTKYYYIGNELINLIHKSNELRILIANFYWGTDTEQIQFRFDDDKNVLLTDEQLAQFTLGKEYGDVFLAYNTVGIPHENYIKEWVIRKNTPAPLGVVQVLQGFSHDYIRPQISFSSEILVYLGDTIKHEERLNILKESIHSWNLVTARLWNFDNYKNAMGLLKIGKVKKFDKSKLKGLQGVVNG